MSDLGSRLSVGLLLGLGSLVGCQGAEGPTSPGGGTAPPAEAQPAAPEKPRQQSAQPEPVGGSGLGADKTGGEAEKKKPSNGLDPAPPPPPAGTPQPRPGPKKGVGQALPELITLADAQAAFALARARLEKAYASGNRGAVALSSGDDRCKTACAAFSSLERSAAAICRLAGSTDTRCSDAKRVVQLHRKKVATCQCS